MTENTAYFLECETKDNHLSMTTFAAALAPLLRDYVLDEQLIIYGKEIIKKREEFIKQISKIIKPIHEDLTNKEEAIKIDYHKNTEVKDFEKNLKRNRSVDLRNKSTSVGPHRDDILFFNKDINIRTYGSQGQKRTIALSLKLAEIELV